MGFRRVSLGPGQSETITVPLGPMSFAHWDTSQHDWLVSAGTYEVMVSSSSRDIAGQGAVALPAAALGG
jgi:beta-glucosidase